MKRRMNGFGCLVSKGPGRPWLARWSYKGRIFTKSTGRVDRAKAEKELERLTRPFRESSEAEVLRSIESRVRAAEDSAKTGRTPLAGMFEAYSESLAAKGLAEGTLVLYGGYAKSLSSWLEANTACREMSDVGKAEAEGYLAFAADAFCPAGYNLRLSFFRKLWRELAGADGPWGSFRKMKVPKAGSRRPFTREELAKALKAASEDPPMLLMFALGIYTGMRLGDCAELSWRDVDREAGLLRVVPRKTKRHMAGPVEIPVHPSLGRLLEWWRARTGADGGYVCPENANAYATRHLERKVRRTLDAAGVSGVSFHSFRHSFISMGIDSGLSPMLVRQIVGHSSVDMTSAYWHSSLDVARSGIAALPDLTGGKAPGGPGGLTEAGMDALRAAFRESDGDLDGTARRLAKLAEAV